MSIFRRQDPQDLPGVQQAQADLQDQVGKLTGRISTAQVELHDLEHACEQKRMELTALNSEIISTRAARDAQHEDLKGRIEQAGDDLAARHEEHAALGEQISGTQEQLARIAGDLSAAQAVIARAAEAEQACTAAEERLDNLRQRIEVQHRLADQATSNLEAIRAKADEVTKETEDRVAWIKRKETELDAKEQKLVGTHIEMADRHKDLVLARADVAAEAARLQKREEDASEALLIAKQGAEAVEARQSELVALERTIAGRAVEITARERKCTEKEKELQLVQDALAEQQEHADTVLAQAEQVRSTQAQAAASLLDRELAVGTREQAAGAREQQLRDVSMRMHEVKLEIEQAIRTNNLERAGIVVPGVPE